jgi:hypothetical protein
MTLRKNVPLIFGFLFLPLFAHAGVASSTTTVAAAPKPKPIPPEPKPVKKAGIEYRAPHASVQGDEPRNGTVEAWDEKTGKILWTRRVYAVAPNVSTDSAHIYITALSVRGNALIVTNEVGNKYRMDLKTREVKYLGQ